MLEALEQRRAKYVEASNQAKASGDDRKARMHDRIAKVHAEAAPDVCIYIYRILFCVCHAAHACILVATTLLSFSRHYSSISSAVWKLISPLLQQYQSAIRAHKAGKAVNFEELPVPPGEILF